MKCSDRKYVLLLSLFGSSWWIESLSFYFLLKTQARIKLVWVTRLEINILHLKLGCLIGRKWMKCQSWLNAYCTREWACLSSDRREIWDRMRRHFPWLHLLDCWAYKCLIQINDHNPISIVDLVVYHNIFLWSPLRDKQWHLSVESKKLWQFHFLHYCAEGITQKSLNLRI